MNLLWTGKWLLSFQQKLYIFKLTLKTLQTIKKDYFLQLNFKLCIYQLEQNSLINKIQIIDFDKFCHSVMSWKSLKSLIFYLFLSFKNVLNFFFSQNLFCRQFWKLVRRELWQGRSRGGRRAEQSSLRFGSRKQRTWGESALFVFN